MTREKQIPQGFGENLLRAMREAIVVLQRGYLTTSSAGVERVATQGARLALSLIQNTLQDIDPPSQSRAPAQGVASMPTGDSKHTRSMRTYFVIDFCSSCSAIRDAGLYCSWDRRQYSYEGRRSKRRSSTNNFRSASHHSRYLYHASKRRLFLGRRSV